MPFANSTLFIATNPLFDWSERAYNINRSLFYFKTTRGNRSCFDPKEPLLNSTQFRLDLLNIDEQISYVFLNLRIISLYFTPLSISINKMKTNYLYRKNT